MKVSDFSFELPQNLIAQFPPERRGQSRLLTLDKTSAMREHRMVDQLPEILSSEKFLSPTGEKPLLVFNNSKVRKARIIGESYKCGQVEFLLLEKTDERKWKALVQRAKRKRVGSSYTFFDASGKEITQAVIIKEEGEFRVLEFDCEIDDNFLDNYGHIPLPPYIKRSDTETDSDRYQTVYAKDTGSSAAPTAGLHFTKDLMDRFAFANIECAFLTLHVGLGTFLPVRSENIEEHIMHSETFSIDEQTAFKIEKAKAAGRKIIAVGTTSVRTLESAWKNGRLSRGKDSTSIFIYPPYSFKVVDAMFTNFHTPESTLLMLVCAFAGKELLLKSYAEAVREGYRFFSYGDAMLIY